MKKISIVAIILYATIAVTTQTVSAATAPKSVDLGLTEIERGTFKHTSNFVKEVWGDQSVNLHTVHTSMTDPCNDCKMGFKPFDTNGNAFTGQTLVRGQTKTFVGHDGSSRPATYNLGVMREDFTLLKTFAGFLWNLY